MKQVYKLTASILLMLIVSSVFVFAQSSGDFRSVGSGNWGDNTKWETYNGTAWTPASSAPTGSGTITLQGTDSLYVNVAVTITGTLVSMGGKVENSATAMTFANGGMFVLAVNNGQIPLATWNTGSTCKVTGYQSGSKPANGNQNFFNFTWDCANQASNIDLAMSGNTIGGDVTIVNTGSSRMQLTSPDNYSAPITINGNIYMQAGQFASNGSSGADTIIVHTHGDIIVTGGNFSISRGSGPNVHWYHHGDFSVTNATLQNSGGSTRFQQLIFSGTTTQNITLSNVTYGGGSAPFTMRVANGATLNLGLEVISSSNTGSFIVEAGGTIETAQPGGFAGNIQCTGGSNGGGNVLNSAASYTFNGSTAQVTGTLMPDTVSSLTIDNASGVTLSKAFVINDTLRLKSGVLDNTIAFTLGPNGGISYEGGSLLHPLSVDLLDGEGIPQTFSIAQNYPNPFNPSTTIRFGIPQQSYVTITLFDVLGQEAGILFEGRREAGVHELHVNLPSLPSGVYFYRVQAGENTAVKQMMLVR